MGHIATEELLNVIRHEMRLEDEDGPGLCSRLLLNPRRKVRSGGLPLGFPQNSNFGDLEDTFQDDDYEVNDRIRRLDSNKKWFNHGAHLQPSNYR